MSMTNAFRRLPGFRRSAPGLEWTVLQRLPSLLGVGMALILAGGVIAHGVLADDKALQLAHAYTAAAALLHLAAVGTVALTCAIVYVMKGPAYVADAYPLPDADAPLSAARDAPAADARRSRDS
jgi:hypothetical protein